MSNQQSKAMIRAAMTVGSLWRSTILGTTSDPREVPIGTNRVKAVKGDRVVFGNDIGENYLRLANVTAERVEGAEPETLILRFDNDIAVRYERVSIGAERPA